MTTVEAFELPPVRCVECGCRMDDAESHTGRWVDDEPPFGPWWLCSECAG